MKTSELVKMLKEAGCKLYKHGTRHDTWQSPLTGKRFQVPRHWAKEVQIGTVNNILKDAGIK